MILNACNGRMNWPKRGVYFFLEHGEERSTSGQGLRVVRVGTHAVSTGSRTTLWQRLSTHRGTIKGGGGNHRGSVFREIVGSAIAAQRPSLACSTWGQGKSAPKDVRLSEHSLEEEVSRCVRAMPFLWIEAGDEPSKDSVRGYIERNSISLISNWKKKEIDPASPSWLGRSCGSEKVRSSGLWNSKFVEKDYDPRFLDILEKFTFGM